MCLGSFFDLCLCTFEKLKNKDLTNMFPVLATYYVGKVYPERVFVKSDDGDISYCKKPLQRLLVFNELQTW